MVQTRHSHYPSPTPLAKALNTVDSDCSSELSSRSHSSYIDFNFNSQPSCGLCEIEDWEEMESLDKNTTSMRFSGKPGTMQIREFFIRISSWIRKQKQRKPDFNEYDAFALLPEHLEDVALQEWENFYQQHDAEIEEVEKFYFKQRRLVECYKENGFEGMELPAPGKATLGKFAKASTSKSQPASTNKKDDDYDAAPEAEGDDDAPLTKQELAMHAVKLIIDAEPPAFQPLYEFRLHLGNVFGGLRADLLEKLANFKKEPGDTLLMMKNRLIELSDRVGNYDDVQKGRIFLAAQPQEIQDALETPLLLQYQGRATLDEVFNLVNALDLGKCATRVQEVSAALFLGKTKAKAKESKNTAQAHQASASAGKVNTSKEHNINKVCNKCGGRGHLARECPSPETVSRMVSQQSTHSKKNNHLGPNKHAGGGQSSHHGRQGKEGGITCHKCKRVGHTASQCWSKDTKDVIQCSHCKRNGHSADRCWLLHPELRPSNQGGAAATAHLAYAMPPNDVNTVNAGILQQIASLLGQRKAMVSSVAVADETGDNLSQSLNSVQSSKDYVFHVMGAMVEKKPMATQSPVEHEAPGGAARVRLVSGASMNEPLVPELPACQGYATRQLRPRKPVVPPQVRPTPSAEARKGGREVDARGRGRLPHSFTIAEVVNDPLLGMENAATVTQSSHGMENVARHGMENAGHGVENAQCNHTSNDSNGPEGLQPDRRVDSRQQRGVGPPSVPGTQRNEVDTQSGPGSLPPGEWSEPHVTEQERLDREHTIAALRLLNSPTFSALQMTYHKMDVLSTLERARAIVTQQVPLDEKIWQAARLARAEETTETENGPAQAKAMNASIPIGGKGLPAKTTGQHHEELFSQVHTQAAREALHAFEEFEEEDNESAELIQSLSPSDTSKPEVQEGAEETTAQVSANHAAPARSHFERERVKPRVVTVRNDLNVFGLQVSGGPRVCPQNVLLDSGAEPVLLGKRTSEALGLTEKDLIECPFKIATSAGGHVEPLGWTRQPLLLSFKVDSGELALFAVRCVVTTSESYDVLVGMSAMYPMGVGYDPWEENAWLRPDYATGGGRKAFFPIRMVAEAYATFEDELVAHACNALVSSGSQLLEGNDHACTAPPPFTSEPGLFAATAEPCVIGMSQSAFASSSARLTTSRVTAQRAHTAQATHGQQNLSHASVAHPPPPWGSLHNLQTQAMHYVTQSKLLPTTNDFRNSSISLEALQSAPKGVQPLDTSTVQLQTDKDGLVVVELFGGTGAGLAALLQTGQPVKRYIYVDSCPTARQAVQHHLVLLHLEFPSLLPPSAIAQSLSALPQNVESITEDALHALGPVDLVIAGWPCQGHSQASGHGKGLEHEQSRLFWILLKLLSWWQTHQSRPLGYVLENVHPLSNPIGQRDLQIIRHFVGMEICVDAASVGSYAHRLRLKWTNLMPAHQLQAAYNLIPRPANRFVDDILDPGRKSQAVDRSDRPPMALVNFKGFPRQALPTLMATPASHAFRSGQPGLVREVVTGLLVEPSAAERERAMGFLPGATAGSGIDEALRRRLLGLAMDVNSMTWLLALCHAHQKQLDPAVEHRALADFSYQPTPVPTASRSRRALVTVTESAVVSPEETKVEEDSYKEVFQAWLQEQPQWQDREEEEIEPETNQPPDDPNAGPSSLPYLPPYSPKELTSLRAALHRLCCKEECHQDCERIAQRLARNAHRQARKNVKKTTESAAAALAATPAAAQETVTPE